MSIFAQGKLSKPQFISKIICAILTGLIFGLITSFPFPGDSSSGLGIMHYVFNWSFGILMFFYIALVMKKSLDESLEFDFAVEETPTKYYAGVGTLVFWLIILVLGGTAIKDTKIIYNKHSQYNNHYVQCEQKKKTYYDNMWKSFKLKHDITDEATKGMFIEVTKIVMGAREDKFQHAWKWVQENQQIPYGEFTRFYADLSGFIEDQRQGMLDLETQSQEIAQRNNTMLDTFPNVMYNYVLNVPHIDYKPSFTSTKTETVFKTHIEDLK